MFNKKMLLVFSLLCAHGFAFGGQIEDKHEFLKSNGETLKELENRCKAMKNCEFTRQTTSEAVKLLADLKEFQNKIDAAKPEFANAYIEMYGITIDSLIDGVESNLSKVSSHLNRMIGNFADKYYHSVTDLKIKKSVDVEAWNQVTIGLEAAANELKELKSIFAGIADDESRKYVQIRLDRAEEKLNKEIDAAKSTLLACQQQAALPTPPPAPNINSDATPKGDGVSLSDQALSTEKPQVSDADPKIIKMIQLLNAAEAEYPKLEKEVEALSILHPFKLWKIKKAAEKSKADILNAYTNGEHCFNFSLKDQHNRIIQLVMYKLTVAAAVFATGTAAAVAAGYAAYKKWFANSELEQVGELEAV